MPVTSARAALATALRDFAPLPPWSEPRLTAVIAETASRPGKLLRAQLVQAGATQHGLGVEEALQLATALEYFHLASLLFDDLPCMDDAHERRGQPCAHRVHGEAATILGALSFINRAYTLVGLALAAQPSVVRVQAQLCVDGCLGAAGLAGGQAHDLAFARSDRSARTVSRIALAKTGALFRLALLLPALPTLATRASAAERRALTALGVHWGLAFQVLDDLQDVLANSADEGKTTGRDRALQRPNLALAAGVPAARRRAERLVALADRALAQLTAAQPGRWEYLARAQQEWFHAATAPVAAAAGVAA